MNEFKLFSMLLYRKNFFKKYNWENSFIDNVHINYNNLSNNKYFNKYKKIYSTICKRFPLDKDLIKFANGFFINNSNIYNIDISKVNSIIIKWDYLERNYLKIIESDCYKLKDYLKSKNLIYKQIFIASESIPDIYTIYKNKIISSITLAYLYYKNEEELKKIIEDSKVQSKNLEKNIFYSELYKSYKILKLLMLQKRKEEK
jgi:hypothetical protein